MSVNNVRIVHDIMSLVSEDKYVVLVRDSRFGMWYLRFAGRWRDCMDYVFGREN